MKNAVVNTSSEKGVLTTAFFMLLLEKECCQRCFLCSFWKRSADNGVFYAPFGKGVLSTAFFLLLLEKEYRQRCFYLNQKRFNSESMLECFSLRFSEPPKV